MDTFIKGTCEMMCSKDEQHLRIKEKMVHFYEMNHFGLPNQQYLLIKSFSRSAAGVKRPKSSDLRTVDALKNTIEYLLKKILIDTRKPYHYIYDFIFDRLRSVRQEIVMQNFDTPTTILLLEPIIMFMAYSSYMLCEESFDNYDPKICNQHLQECLKRLLICYDDNEFYNNGKGYNFDRRIFFECLYLTFNLGNIEALNRALRLNQRIRSQSLFEKVFRMSVNYHNNIFHKVLKDILQLPHILQAVAVLKIQNIRREIFLRFSFAYQSKLLSCPLNWLQNILLYSDLNDLIADCKYYGMEINVKENNLKFSRITFNGNIPVIKNRKQTFVNKNLNLEHIPSLMFLNDSVNYI